jgi:hypothetical protein
LILPRPFFVLTRFAGALILIGLLITPWVRTALAIPAESAAAAGTVSLAEYRSRLASLDKLVAGCRDALGPAHCSGDQVGPDVQVALPSGARQVRFGWLRDLLELAAKPEVVNKASSEDDGDAASKPDQQVNSKDGKSAAAKPGEPQADPSTAKPVAVKPSSLKPPPPNEDKLPILAPDAKPKDTMSTIIERLDDARKRLHEDSEQAGKLAAQMDRANAQAGVPVGIPAQGQVQGTPTAKPVGSPIANSGSVAHRQALARILSAKEYKTAVVGRSLRDRILEKFANWVNRIFTKLAGVGSKSKWIGRSFEIGFIVVLCIALVWFLIRLERQGRLNSSAFRPEPGSEAASARDWQLWLQDAKKAAAAGEWRDAIHLLYWASISRLESSGEWPADRARTPREYLALLGQESQQRPALSALTRSFERTWYAGRVAAEADFLQAEQQAARLGAR